MLFNQVPFALARETSEIPGPGSYPIVGSILAFKPFGDINPSNRLEMGKTLYNRYGSICKMKLPIVSGDSVFIFDPADFEKVYR